MAVGTQQVKVGGRALTLIAEGSGWEVFDEQGTPLGRVFIGSYRYWPDGQPGIRIPRCQRAVRCWRNDRARHRLHWKTRREALADLLRREDQP